MVGLNRNENHPNGKASAWTLVFTTRVDEDEGSLPHSRVNPDKDQEKIGRSAEALWDCQTQHLSLQII
ncbi:MAG: hypothetical protein A2X25_13300 [Chloroflexi bacterium GWB2_49_20]|nr:MAG: hypothetical protein A2X25_13300 [Chloroflexi bacterium GWB2_49_20]OGN80035.1 MAG: hypothetical protein A2X26_03450 [Chloroflexi bacterium GWC2_49_37]OGN85429.1 MAG: hypothetical protein A2X27_03610 [Chloroflexi bacterium GWD2_49_16]HBG74290.1 hypothetical protein [Anaerolineae bacterium]HCM97100.1 hypothetical protein [Anaerolineae bacterium]